MILSFFFNYEYNSYFLLLFKFRMMNIPICMSKLSEGVVTKAIDGGRRKGALKLWTLTIFFRNSEPLAESF